MSQRFNIGITKVKIEVTQLKGATGGAHDLEEST